MTLPNLVGPLTGLHDGQLRSIAVSEGRASLGVTHVDGRRFTLELGGVEALCIDGFREGNIISKLQVVSCPNFDEVGLSVGDVLANLEALFLRPHQSAAAEYHSKYDAFRDRQLARLEAGTARLVLLEPAYGADLLAYCTSVDLILDEDRKEGEG
jgi:hypothetical protein